ncbi:hypothetical protein QA644_08215 [Rhizobium sp. CC1099]|uniref:hypothetical protein n=1 Tax=Rhizobium sp. CC1099 TaxID=3039160 RepID=UPI0024B28175|nr:hypothetical protein [Rhizobium sp. CC1099]WFU89013.1 hypothetical protein QA644_08215 [Rhizobium sp. CC1099]
MLEVSNGLPNQLIDAKVLFTGQIVLSPDQEKFRYTGEEGIQIEFWFDFRPDAVPRVRTENDGNSYLVVLVNFGDPLGMAASGKISAAFAGSAIGRSGTWQLRYNLVVQNIGESNRPTRLVTFTLAEARLA